MTPNKFLYPMVKDHTGVVWEMAAKRLDLEDHGEVMRVTYLYDTKTWRIDFINYTEADDLWRVAKIWTEEQVANLVTLLNLSKYIPRRSNAY